MNISTANLNVLVLQIHIFICNFTIDDVKNSIRASSDSNPDPEPVDTSFTITRAFDYAIKSNTGKDTLEEEDGYYILPWKIDVNPDLRATGEITFTDTLQNSELQKYDPSSFEIKAFDENGQEVAIPNGTYTLPKDTDSSWTQSLPAQLDGKTVRYEITYHTKVAVDEVPGYSGTTVGNKIEVGGETSDPGTVTIPGQLDYQVDKNAVGYDMENKTADWNVTVTVPKEGFSQSFTVSDTLPSLWYGNPSTLYKHTLDTESLQVMLGDSVLKQYTDYTLIYNKNLYGADDFKLIFHMNEGGAGGLPSSDVEQKITITYKTSYEDWISGQAVINTVSVDADGKNRSDTAQYTPVDKSIVKEANDNFTASDVNHTVTYTVAVMGVTQDDLDENGCIQVTDTFDPDYLRFVDRNWEGGKIVYGTQRPGSYEENAGESYTVEESNGTLTFTFKPQPMS